MNDPFFKVKYFSFGREFAFGNTSNKSSYKYGMKPLIESLIQTDGNVVKGKVVFLFNLGVHVHNEDDYGLEFENLLETFIPALLKGHSVYFRETGAQHFATTTGGYNKKPLDSPSDNRTSIDIQRNEILLPNQSFLKPPQKRKSVHNFRCRPIADKEAAYSQNWRNRIASDIIDRMNSNLTRKYENFENRIMIIPWYNITLPRYDYHVNNEGDCTHYCFGSMIFAPIWNYLVQSIKKNLTY
jgi:hypothetical protein